MKGNNRIEEIHKQKQALRETILKDLNDANKPQLVNLILILMRYWEEDDKKYRELLNLSNELLDKIEELFRELEKVTGEKS